MTGDLRDLDDEALIARVLAGELAVFEVVMRRHNARVFRTARAILKDGDEAEDAMQEAWVSAYEHLRDFGGRARFSTWLTRITVHAALGRLRKARRTTSLDDETVPEGAMSETRSPEDNASDVELRAMLEDVVDALPPAFRAVFVMRAAMEMSVAETAEALEIPEETVRTRLHRARGLLRDELLRRSDTVATTIYDFHLVRCDRVVTAVFERIREKEKRRCEES